MKTLKSMFVLVILSLVACHESENLNDTKLNLERYVQLEEALTADFNTLSQGLRNNSSNFTNKTIVVDVAQQHYGLNSAAYNSFITSFNASSSNSNGRISSETTLTSVQLGKIVEILNSIDSSPSLEDFLLYLDNQASIIATTPRMLFSDKDFLLTYIASYKASLVFIQSNIDLILEGFANPMRPVLGGRTHGWWDSWGKCAAGILGGAGTGALTFGLAGAAVGTVALPVVGTVSAGLVGSVGGAIAGGLTGAAASC